MNFKPMQAVECLYVVASQTGPDVVTGRDLAHIHRLRGYSEIAVHFVIDKDGTVTTGRAPNKPAPLAGKRNLTSLQVALLGGEPNPETRRPVYDFTPAQLEALGQLSDELMLPLRYAPTFPTPDTD